MEGLVDGRGSSEANKVLGLEAGKAIQVTILQKFAENCTIPTVQLVLSDTDRSHKFCSVLRVEDFGVELNLCFVGQLLIHIVEYVIRIVVVLSIILLVLLHLHQGGVDGPFFVSDYDLGLPFDSGKEHLEQLYVCFLVDICRDGYPEGDEFV